MCADLNLCNQSRPTQAAPSQSSIGGNAKTQMVLDTDPAAPSRATPSLAKFDPSAYGKPKGFQKPRQQPQAAAASPATDNVPLAATDTRTVNDKSESCAVVIATEPGHGIASATGTNSPSNKDMTSTKQPVSVTEHDRPQTNKKGDSKSARKKRTRRPRDHKKVAKGAATGKGTPSQQKETLEERLQRVQKQEMTKIGNKIRQKGAEETTNTQVLHLARQTSTNFQDADKSPKEPQAGVSTLSSAANTQLPSQRTTIASRNESTVPKKADGSRLEAKVPIEHASDVSVKGKRRDVTSRHTTGRWATAAEMKPPPRSPARSIDSNAFGSPVSSDDATGTGDSVMAMENGRVPTKRGPTVPEASLADWSGNLMPPPIEWDMRPRFNNNTAEFIGDFCQWNDSTVARSLNADTGIPFNCLSNELVNNPDLHPDGLNLVESTIGVDGSNAEHYGYWGEALLTIKQDATPIHPQMFIDDWGKLDLRKPENLKIKDEKCIDLLRSFNAKLAKAREAGMRLRKAQILAQRETVITRPARNPHIPKANIYLRPAGSSDIPQLREIYNFYVKNSARTAEIQPIANADMMGRWVDCTNEKLPFIVAVSKSAKVNREVDDAVEKIVGWACATDWVGRHAVERFTVELEIYVHQNHLHQGVGKCLMDKLIDSTDRAHISRRGYPFSCASELQHAYSAGGARDLMKLLMIVRSFDKPRRPNENDLPWIKKWLEDEWGFEEQGRLPRIGVKFQRYVNQTCFVRTTGYAPKEHQIPE